MIEPGKLVIVDISSCRVALSVCGHAPNHHVFDQQVGQFTEELEVREVDRTHFLKCRVCGCELLQTIADRINSGHSLVVSFEETLGLDRLSGSGAFTEEELQIFDPALHVPDAVTTSV